LNVGSSGDWRQSKDSKRVIVIGIARMPVDWRFQLGACLKANKDGHLQTCGKSLSPQMTLGRRRSQMCP
jgi:hypothetical protein